MNYFVVDMNKPFEQTINLRPHGAHVTVMQRILAPISKFCPVSLPFSPMSFSLYRHRFLL